MKSSSFTLVTGLYLLLPQLSLATNFCVNSAQELSDSLQIAQNNGEDDVIKIRSGDYALINGDSFRFDNSENHDLTISGGWSHFNQFDCFTQPGQPIDTSFDGDDLSQVLYIQNNAGGGDITIENLTISNGFSNSVGESGGLRLYSDLGYTGEMLVDRLFFVGNETENFNGSALSVVGGPQITVRNSVFTFNTTDVGSGAVSISLRAQDRGVYFINNTLINNYNNNTSTSAPNTSGLSLNLNQENNDIPAALIANNLFWDNQGSDFWVSFSGGITRVYNNNFQDGFGFIDDSANNLSLDPMLSPLLINFAPEEGSPLIGQGLSMPETIPFPTPFFLEWDHGTQDFDGGIIQRVHYGRVDMGAVESAFEGVIFENGFE